MAWTMTDEIGEFLAVAGDFLRSRPAEHTLQLTTVARLSRRGLLAFGDAPPLLGWWADGGEPEAVFVHTPPYPVSVTPVPDRWSVSLAVALLEAVPGLSGIGARVRTAECFADRWRAGTGAGVEVHRRMRLYRLGDLVPPDPRPAGHARAVRESDREVVCRWLEGFGRDVGNPVADAAAQFEDRLGHSGMLLWEVDGVPVSMAGCTPNLSGMARVAPVYTPAEYRGRGYGSAATEAVSRAARELGAAEVLLFTDLANPTSNAIYQRLGYRPVEDRVELLFTPPVSG